MVFTGLGRPRVLLNCGEYSLGDARTAAIEAEVGPIREVHLPFRPDYNAPMGPQLEAAELRLPRGADLWIPPDDGYTAAHFGARLAYAVSDAAPPSPLTTVRVTTERNSTIVEFF